MNLKFSQEEIQNMRGALKASTLPTYRALKKQATIENALNERAPRNPGQIPQQQLMTNPNGFGRTV